MKCEILVIFWLREEGTRTRERGLASDPGKRKGGKMGQNDYQETNSLGAGRSISSLVAKVC